ncbi:hypothetical protein MHYP_G00241340 [Metynnis hypsauchen]
MSPGEISFFRLQIKPGTIREGDCSNIHVWLELTRPCSALIPIRSNSTEQCEGPAAAAAADISVSDSVSEVGAHGVDTERLDGSRASSEAHEGEGGSETAPSAQVEAVSTGDAAVGESVVSVDMPVTQEEEGFSDLSDIASQAGEDQPLYSVQEINAFLDETFGKVVEMTDFFPDVERFVASVAKIRKTANFDDLSKQKRFRLKKILTKLRRGKAPVKRKCSD